MSYSKIFITASKLGLPSLSKGVFSSILNGSSPLMSLSPGCSIQISRNFSIAIPIRQAYQAWSNSKRSPYEILKLKPDSDFSEIKERYRKMCFELHPDRSGTLNLPDPKAKDALVEVIQAYQYLKNLKDQSRLNRFSQTQIKREYGPYTAHTVYPGGPYSTKFSNSGFKHNRSMFGNHPPVYGENSRIFFYILLVTFLALIFQSLRFRSIHGSVTEMREKQFELSARAYSAALELGSLLGREERIKLFIKQYNERKTQED